MEYLGKHALVDIYLEHNSTALTNPNIMMDIIEKAVLNENATILTRHVSEFDGREEAAGGFTGMFVLSESHASIHTWPEYGVATIDVYMCGECDAFACIENIVTYLKEQDYEPECNETKICRGFYR